MSLFLSRTFTFAAFAAGALMTAVAVAPVEAQAQYRGGWGRHGGGWGGGPRHFRPRHFGPRPWGPAWGFYAGPRRCVVRWRWVDTPWGVQRRPVRRCW